SFPVAANGTVYFGSSDGNLYAVDGATGQAKWVFKTGGWINPSPVVTDGMVFIGSDDKNLYAVDLETGKEKWRFKATDAVNTIAGVSSELIFIGSNDGNLYGVDVQTGQEKWRFHNDESVWSSVIGDGVIYFGSGVGDIRSQQGSLHAVDIRSGKD